MRRREFVLSAAAASTLAPASAGARTDAFRLGLTPVFLNNDREILSSFKTYLEARMGREAVFVQRRTYEEITNLLLVGDLEAAWICGFPYLKHRASLEVVAVPVWRGAPLYRSYLIVAADRPAKGWDDLAGDLHAFSDPDSNSGYLVTVSELLKRNLRADEFFDRTIFTYGHRNVVRAVASRLTDSGSVDGYVWEALAAVEPELTRRTKAIWKSEELGFPPIACRAGEENSEPIAAFRKALLDMAQAPGGHGILGQLQLDGFQLATPGLFAGIQSRIDIVARKA